MWIVCAGKFSECYRKWCKCDGYFFKQTNAEEVYNLAKNAVVLCPKSDVTKILVQEASNQLTAISRSVETYRIEMERPPCIPAVKVSCGNGDVWYWNVLRSTAYG